MPTGQNKEDNASPKAQETIPMQDVLKFLFDLAQLHKITRQFSLIREFRDEAGASMFEVRLTLGDETYTAQGRSIRGAQRAAAALALEKTKLAKPPMTPTRRQASPPREKNPPRNQTFEHKSPYNPAVGWYLEKRLDEINATEDQLETMRFMVNELERSLKQVSDNLTARAKEAGTAIPKVYQDLYNSGGKKPDDEFRLLKGVMRVGNMAKNVILRTDREVKLVLLCACKPTLSLLHEVCSELQAVLEDFSLVAEEEHARIRVEYNEYQAKISLSSIVFRQENFDGEKAPPQPDPIDALPTNKCLESLAEVRHAKWFQATFTHRQNATKALKLLRDLAIRRPKPWADVPQWMFELLLDHCATPMVRNPPVSWIFRKMMEILASGILYDGSLGIFDPCEKQTTNAVAGVPLETRELVTREAQYFIRLLAFRRAYDILDMARSDVSNTNTQWG